MSKEQLTGDSTTISGAPIFRGIEIESRTFLRTPHLNSDMFNLQGGYVMLRTAMRGSVRIGLLSSKEFKGVSLIFAQVLRVASTRK